MWTWTAIDADSKLILSWLVGSRDAGSAYEFMQDVATRLRFRVQMTTDAHRPYLNAVEDAFGSDIDYATLQKMYGSDPEDDKRYSPAKCIGVECKVVQDDPNPKHSSTSYIERQNLAMRMSMRRFTRLTNAFSKGREPRGSCGAILHVLQLRPDSSDASGDPCDGSRRHGSRLVGRGNRAARTRLRQWRTQTLSGITGIN